MTKPTKTRLIAARESSYREQAVECCGTCRYFVPHYMVPHYSGPLRGQVGSRCAAITLRGEDMLKDISYLGKCDLYESRKGGAK